MDFFFYKKFYFTSKKFNFFLGHISQSSKHENGFLSRVEPYSKRTKRHFEMFSKCLVFTEFQLLNFIEKVVFSLYFLDLFIFFCYYFFVKCSFFYSFNCYLILLLLLLLFDETNFQESKYLIFEFELISFRKLELISHC